MLRHAAVSPPGLRVLGPLEYRPAGPPGGCWHAVGASKARLVLAILAGESGRVVTAERILAEAWPEEAPANGVKCVAQTVFRLRRMLHDGNGQWLATHASAYALHATTDADHAAQLIAEGRAALAADDPETASERCEEALALWRGAPYTDVPPMPGVTRHTRELAALQALGLSSRIDADLALGRHWDVLGDLERMVHDDPLHEYTWGQLMLALYRCGRQADAFAAYGRIRAILVEQLGVEPGQRLRDLHQHMLRSSPDLDAPEPRTAAGAPGAKGPATVHVPRELPAAPRELVGRDKQVDLLAAALTANRTRPRLAVVTGSGGIGKTALALTVAQQVAGCFPDGQLYCDLGAFGPYEAPLDASLVLDAVLGSLGVGREDIPREAGLAARLARSLLAERRMLLMLDNADDADVVRALLPGTGPAAVVVTSRAPLADLLADVSLTLGPLDRADAIDLLTRFLVPEQVDAEPHALAEIADACAGLPLGLCLAGARLRARPTWRLATLAERLRDPRTRLEQLALGGQSVRQCLTVSHDRLLRGDLLDSAAARAFRTVGSLPLGEFTELTTAQLLMVDLGWAASILDRLVDARLIEEVAPGHFRVPELTRLLACELAVRYDGRSETLPTANRPTAHE